MKKKLLAILLCSAALLSLCACSSKTPASTDPAEQTADPAELPASETDLSPSQAPASETDITVPDGVLFQPHVTLIPIGQSYSADLNGDGNDEDICVSLEKDSYGWDRVTLTLNGEDCTDSIYIDGVTRFDTPDSFYWAITDVYTVDNLLEIAIQDWGPSDDYYTNFFRYDGSNIYPLGGVEGLIWVKSAECSDLSFEEDGFIDTYSRLSVLQTWYGKVRYTIGEREWLVPVEQELFYATYPTEVTTLAPLTAYDGKDGDSFTVDAGTKMTILATDNAEWLYCESEAEDWALWFHLNPESGFEIETPDGYLRVWDTFEGLCFAD